jgi:hypothetical protein
VTTRRTDYDRVARAIVDVARRAPSVDNTQPWTWCPDRADLGLRADLARALPASDPDGRLLTISCGAALHYARTAAEAMGWDTRVDLLPCPGDPGLLASPTGPRARSSRGAGRPRLVEATPHRASSVHRPTTAG